jgi:hypothetical protein
VTSNLPSENRAAGIGGSSTAHKKATSTLQKANVVSSGRNTNDGAIAREGHSSYLYNHMAMIDHAKDSHIFIDLHEGGTCVYSRLNRHHLYE